MEIIPAAFSGGSQRPGREKHTTRVTLTSSVPPSQQSQGTRGPVTVKPTLLVSRLGANKAEWKQLLYLQHSQESVLDETEPVSEAQMLIQSWGNKVGWTGLKNIAPRLNAYVGSLKRVGLLLIKGGRANLHLPRWRR